MGFLTKYGSAWGAIPMTGGSVFWVAPSASYTVDGRAYSASDGNDGLSPERAVLTIGQAIALATADVGDVICLLPGTHTTASAAAASKAGLTFVGLPYLPESDNIQGIPQVTVTGTTAIAIAVTAADVSFYNIKFVPITQFQCVTFTTAADRLRFRHCTVDFTGVVGHANTKGICATGATQAPRGVRFQGCFFKAGCATTSAGYAIDMGAATDWIIERCMVFHDGSIASAAAWAVAIKLNDGANGVLRDNDFIANNIAVAVTKFVSAVSMTGASTVQVFGNRMSVNTGGLLLDDFAAADVDLALNYVATVAGGTGGTLITATT
jgi:hypothetical protein